MSKSVRKKSVRKNAFIRALATGTAVSALSFLIAAAEAGENVSGKSPAISLPTSTGASDSLANHKGDVVMVNFWASWCEPCRTEFPLIDGLYKKYKKLGFTVLAINIEPDSKAAQGFLKNTPVSFPVLLDSKNTISDTYKVEAMPTTVMIDRNGNMRFLHRGYQPGYEADYEKEIRTLLKE